MTRIIAYLRVSTQKQGVSGLGLEAQKATIEAYARSTGATLVETVIEVESGRKCARPQLALAMAKCKALGATLAVAKLDRLARDVVFIATLMRDSVDFIACDMPSANKLTLHILAAVAEDEARRISERTKAALQAAKARGVVLGAHGRRFGAEEARALNAQRSANAKAWATSVKPTIDALKADGAVTLQAIADGLNGRGLSTPRGGPWRPSTVQRVLAA